MPIKVYLLDVESIQQNVAEKEVSPQSMSEFAKMEQDEGSVLLAEFNLCTFSFIVGNRA